ncbi:MAG: IMS domain-containing protein [Acidobacteriota bacterium]
MSFSIPLTSGAAMLRSAPMSIRCLTAMAMTLLVILLAGCADEAQRNEDVRPEVETLINAYLPALGQFYETGDTSLVEGLAAEKEVFTVEQRIRKLAEAGRRVRATPKQVSIERIDVYQYSNAYVTTFELWDLEVIAIGSERQISQVIDQPNQVRYQLKRSDGRWKILFRELVKTEE